MDETMKTAAVLDGALGYGDGYMSPILPPKDPDEERPNMPTSVLLPRWMAARIDQLARARNYRSRSEVLVRLLEWALESLDREEREAAERAREGQGASAEPDSAHQKRGRSK